MILNIPDPHDFFAELSEVAVFVNGKVTPEALYVLRKYEQKPVEREIEGSHDLRLVPRLAMPEYVPMAVPCEGDNPDGVD